jgi:Flp pilus assembly pilin Flp
MKQLINKFIADEQGQDIIEYALLGSFVSFGAYVAAQGLGASYSAWFDRIGDVVDGATVVTAP